MQGKSSSVEPLPEAFELELESSLSNSSINQHNFWSSVLPHPVEAQGRQDYAAISFLNMSNCDNAQPSIWSSNGPSTSQHLGNQGNHEETKFGHGWESILKTRAAGGPRIEERNSEATNVLSLENANINWNTSQVDGQSLSQASTLNLMRLNSAYAADQVDVGSEASDWRLSHYPSTLGLWNSETHPSIGPSNSYVSSSMAEESVLEVDGNSMYGRRLASKRKNVEVLPGQSSSASVNASSSHQGESGFLPPAWYSNTPTRNLNIPSSMGYLSFASSNEDNSQGFPTATSGMISDCYPTASTANAESSQRNYRMRINSAQLPDVTSSTPWTADAVRDYNIWPLSQPYSHSISLNQSLEPPLVYATSTPLNQHQVPGVPGLPRAVYHMPWNGATNSRIASSLSSFNTEGRIISRSEEANSRNIPVTSNLDFVPTIDSAIMIQGPANRSLVGRGKSIASTSRAGTSTGFHPSVGSAWLPHQSASTQYPQNLSEYSHQSLYSCGISEPGSRTILPLQPSGHPLSFHETAQQNCSRSSQPALHIRSALVDRQSDGAFSAPLPLRSTSTTREARNRVLSEMRRTLVNLRRVQDLQLQAVFLAGAGLHDRHRDMRLDVDNMSYEELLALEERIGNVSTGLSEETILKYLKQRKHSLTLGQSMENEPCCICREEYVEGEDLGKLDCGHDFHTACIKQWLMHKNLCPICKSTALVT